MNIKNIVTMNKYTYALIIITSLILGGTIVNNASAYVIDHNNHSVWVEGNYGKLEATPHTITQSGWVYFNITPYQNIGNIDMVWGFNTSEVKPQKAEFFKPHLVHWTTDHERFFWNVSKIKFTLDDCCCGNSYNIYKRKVTYQTGYNNVTNEPITTTETVCFDSYTHNGTNYTVYWTTHHSRLENWIDVSNKLNSINYNYDNKTRWWYVTNFAVEPYKTYTGRIWINVPVSLKRVSGKYDFAVKRSSDSLHDAISNNRFYLLDPWFDSSWSTKRNLHINYNVTVSQKELNNPTEDGYIYSSTYTRYNDSNAIYSYVYNVSANKIYRGYVEWNISSIPDDAIITNVTFKYHGDDNHGDAHINQMICQPSISSNQDVYDDIGNGTTYINQDGFPEIGENKEINLGSNAISDLQNALSNDWFAIGLQEDEIIDGKYSKIYSEDYVSANPKPTLYVEYTLESETLNYYQMNLNLSYSDITEAQPDFDDIRFVNISDGASLPYWIEDRVNGSWCNVWVNVTSLYAGWNNDTVALYYGNVNVTSASDISTTFIFFDDFDDNDLSDWTQWGTANMVVSNGIITSASSDSEGVIRHEIDMPSGDYVVENRYRSLITDWQGYSNLGVGNNGSGGSGWKRDFEGYMGYVTLYHPLTPTNRGFWVQLDNDGSMSTIIKGPSDISGTEEWIHTHLIILSDGTYKYYSEFDSDYDSDWIVDTTFSQPFNRIVQMIRSSNGEVDWVRIRKYTFNPPTYILGDAKSYTLSITPPTKPSFTEIDLIDQLHHEYTHIEPETMHIPIYTGLNYISIPLYQYNTSLNAVFNDHPVDYDRIYKCVNGARSPFFAQYYNGIWCGASDIEPIEPCVGYEYNRTGDNFTLNVSGYMKYNITTFNYENRVGTNIIRPMRSDKDD